MRVLSLFFSPFFTFILSHLFYFLAPRSFIIISFLYIYILPLAYFAVHSSDRFLSLSS